MKITHKDIELAICDSIDIEVSKIIDSFDMEYEDISDQELQEAHKKIYEVSNGDLKKSGKHRAHEWEHGWKENKELFKENKTLDSILPRYFGKFPYVRFRGKLIKQISKNLEYDMLRSIEYHYFQKYMSKSKNIYEFGCGTGHNLFRARQINNSANLIGLDWATSSQHILEELNNSGTLKCTSHKFDFFDPDYSIEIASESAIYTIAALEQIGSLHENFIQYILSKRPEVCVHIEPIIELLDTEKSFLDSQCEIYCKNRNYLQGFLPRLQNLQNEGKLQIIEAKKTNIGSFLLEGYSIVVWRPV